MGLIVFIIIGFIAGLLARAITPGDRQMGLVFTTLLGMAGSLVGGVIGSLITPTQPFLSIHPTGIILSTLGAILLLLVTGFVGHRSGGIHA